MDQPEAVEIIFFEVGRAGGSVNRLLKLLELWDFGRHPVGVFTFYDCSKAHQLLQAPGPAFAESFRLQDQPLPDPVWKLGPLVLPTRFGLGYWYRALVLLARHPKALVYINNTPYPHLPLLAAALLLRRKIFCHLRDTIAFTALERLIMPRITSFVALSQVARTHYLAQGIAPEAIRVIYDSIDAGHYASERSRSGDGAAPVRIAVTGTLTHRKGQDLCLKAMRQVVAKHPEAQLVLIGDGDLRGELTQMSAEFGLADNVIFQGHTDAVPALLAGCAIGVLCSRREGMPNSVMEYMASGLPVVVSDLPGIDELVTDGVSGFVIPQECPESLAQRLIELIENPQLRRRMGEEGLLRVRSGDFAPNTELSRIEEMLFR